MEKFHYSYISKRPKVGRNNLVALHIKEVAHQWEQLSKQYIRK